ncbi:MAG: peptidase [Porticoccaceae bacterium]|nr:peptidase [Porticoccaceae bacterium]
MLSFARSLEQLNMIEFDTNFENPSIDDGDIATGRTNRHVVEWTANESTIISKKIFIHHQLVNPLNELKLEAAKYGFDLCVCSGFRSYDQQATIWNEKLSGRRDVLSGNGKVLNLAGLSDYQKVEAIMRWSALPGTSRHHWGSDIDVFDGAAIPTNYQLRLVPEETSEDGVFGPMHAWLDKIIDSKNGFFRPYNCDNGGLAPERWHLSYAPIATHFARLLTPELIKNCLMMHKISLHATVIENFHEIYRRFVSNYVS